LYNECMRFINIKQFHAKMWEEIDNLPVVVTKYGIPVFIIVSWAEFAEGNQAIRKQPIAENEEISEGDE